MIFNDTCRTVAYLIHQRNSVSRRCGDSSARLGILFRKHDTRYCDREAQDYNHIPTIWLGSPRHPGAVAASAADEADIAAQNRCSAINEIFSSFETHVL